jgi:predicted RND superfamily exporter protein
MGGIAAHMIRLPRQNTAAVPKRAPMADDHQERPNPFFLAWGRTVVRHRWIFLILTLLTAAGSMALVATKTRVDTSIEAFIAQESDTQRLLEEYRDEFGRDAAFIVLVEGDVFTMPYLERLKKLHDELAVLDMEVPSLGQRKSDRRPELKAPASAAPKTGPPEADPFGGDDFGGFDDAAADSSGDGWGEEAGGSIVDEIISLVNARQTRGTADGIEVGELLDPWPSEADLPALKKRALNDTFLVGQMVGKAGKHSAILVRSQFMSEEDSIKVNRKIAEIAKGYNAPDFKTSVTGMPALNDGLNTLMMGDLGKMLGLSVILMIIVLTWMFRNVVGVFVPLMVVGMSALNTFAVMALVESPVTMLSNILPAFLFCVGLGDSIHLISVYRDGRNAGMDAEEAVIQAVGTTGMPVFYTSITTMVGLASFKFASLGAIQDMGVAGAFGVFMAFIHSMVLLPIALTFIKKSRLGLKGEGSRDRLDAFLDWCNSRSGFLSDKGTGPAPDGFAKRRNRTLLAGALFIVVAGIGVSQLYVWHNPLAWIPEGEPTRENILTMDEHIGGTNNLQLLIDGTPEKGIKDQALLEGLEKLQAHIMTYQDKDVGKAVGNSVSILEVVKETNRALRGGEQSHYVLPKTQEGINNAVQMFEFSGADQLRRLATNDLSRTQMTLRIKWLEAMSYVPLTKHVAEGIEKFIPKTAKVRPTGSIYTLVTTVGSIIGDLLRSFGVALGIITLIMMVLLRSLKLGLIAMVPNLMPICFILGLMGFADIPIDMNNLLIASIAIGIAVDDTIHFLHHFRIHYDGHGNVEDAIRASMRHSGRAMASTTVILMVGFFAYMAAAMENIVRFGLLVGMTALMALLIDLLIAPALLRLFYARPKEDTHAA